MSNLYDRLKLYGKSDFVPFHMPGHKRKPEKFGMEAAAGIDITEIDGFDDYHYPQEIIKEVQEQAAEIYGTDYSFYLVNGSTAGLLTAISAVTSYGDSIVVARNCHKAVYNAISIRGLMPEYIYPKMCGDWGILGGISSEDVAFALERTGAKAVVITSPTYEGILSDVTAIAGVCHKNGAVLIVDEAHGAHFNYSDEFPDTAMKCGADIVIESLHKTLPSYTQTAIIHVKSNFIDINCVRRYLSIYQTSSPSYIFMAGINRCIDYMISECGQTVNKEYISNLKILRANLLSLKNIRLLEPQGDCFDYDISKLVLCVPGKGAYLHNVLLEKYHIQPEMASADYIIAMTSIGDDFGWYDKLFTALKEIDEGLGCEEKYISVGWYEEIRAQVVISPAKALENTGEEYDLFKSCGKIAMECMYAYPPGIPLVYPGELITEEFLEKIKRMRQSGIMIKGLNDHKGDKILCIK